MQIEDLYSSKMSRYERQAGAPQLVEPVSLDLGVMSVSPPLGVQFT